MTFFSPILLVNLIVCLTSIHIRLTDAAAGRCVMRHPCSPHKQLNDYDDPTSVKWYNCKYDGEPRPLENKQALDDFKKLCSSMYVSDEQPLCCTSEQLTILKKDLLTAQALIGSCSSCDFNFRQMWCQFACSPNQADFVVPFNVTARPSANFTLHLDIYRKTQADNDNLEGDNNEEHGGDEEEQGEEDYQYNYDNNEEATSATTAGSHVSLKASTAAVSPVDEAEEVEEETEDTGDNDYSDSARKKRETRAKRHLPAGSGLDRSMPELKKIEKELKKVQIQAVMGVNLFIDRSFMDQMVDSCRDIKIYGDDALQGLCGEPAHSCTGLKIADFLGLKVNLRPFNIHFQLEDRDSFNYTHTDPVTLKETTYAIQTIKPRAHACNETFQYGDLAYGAKCSCKVS